MLVDLCHAGRLRLQICPQITPTGAMLAGIADEGLMLSVHHRAVELFRKDSTRTARDVSDDEALERQPAPDNTAQDVDRRDDAAATRTALSDIPHDQRHVIVLAHFGGYTRAEIAAMLQIPTGPVRGRMRLGMSKLRLSLGALAGAET